MTEPQRTPVDRSKIGELTVIAVAPARGVAIPGQPEALIKNVEECLLENGETVYRCSVKPDECEYVHDSVKSVTAHQRSHSEKLQGRRATKELALIDKKEREEFERRSAGVTAANEAKKQRYVDEVTATDERVRIIQRKMSDLAYGIDKIAEQVPRIATAMRELNAELNRIQTTSATDDEIRAKAKKYDALKGLMKD